MQRVKLFDLAIVVVKNSVSKRCFDFMHPMNMKNKRVNVAVITFRWWKSELKCFLLNYKSASSAFFPFGGVTTVSSSP
jgi:hypothetical protein